MTKSTSPGGWRSPRDRAKSNAGVLTAEEIVAIAKVQHDSSIVGYAILRKNGEEIESGGAWKDVLAPVFSNVLFLADRIGSDFGVASGCGTVYLEGADVEVVGLMLTSARAVFIRRKLRSTTNALRVVH